MKAEYDFSKAERGKFYDPKAVFNLPIYLEKDVDEFMRKLADEKGKDVEEMVNDWLRGNRQLTLEEHIDDIRDKLVEMKIRKEAAVSQGIVLRLLKALAWPISNTQIVHPEYSVGGGSVDFALCLPESTPQVLIEVKQVGKIEGAEQQLFKYVLDYDGVIPIAVITNGREWQFFHPTGEGTWAERKVCELDFTIGNSAGNAEKLNRYLNYESIRTGEAIESIKKDYEQGGQQKQVAIQLPKMWSKSKVTQTVAYRQWCNETHKPWEKVRGMIPSQFSLDSILASDAYAYYVKQLMQTYYDTPKKFHEWVDSFKRDMSKTFGRRIGLSSERAQQIIDEVRKEHNSTAQRSNKNE